MDMLINLYYFIHFFFFFKEGATGDSVSQAGSTIQQLTRPRAAALLCQPLQRGADARVGGLYGCDAHVPVFINAFIAFGPRQSPSEEYFPFYT